MREMINNNNPFFSSLTSNTSTLTHSHTNTGEVSTIAGCGTQGSTDGPAAHAQLCCPAGIVVDVHTGAIYFSENGSHKLKILENAL